MSTASLRAFLESISNDLNSTNANDKRLEYNLLTHSFTYNESVFKDEMIKELQSRSVYMSTKRRVEIERLAELFSKRVYGSISKIDALATQKGGVTRLKGSPTSFSFIFTTDTRTGKTPNNWAKGQADVFDKIKVSYSDAYREFFFGVKATFEKGSEGLKKFNKVYNFREELDIQSKGKMGQSGHAEGEGIIETMTREFFDRHANTVFDKATGKTNLTETQLLSDLQKLGIDISFMRSTSDMTQNISLIGAGGNNFSGNVLKQKLKKAKDRLDKILKDPAILNEMMDLQGSDSFRTIKNKKILQETLTPFKKLKNVKVTTENIKIKNSKKSVKKKSKGTATKAAAVSSVIRVRGISSLSRKSAQSNSFNPLAMLATMNQQLPKIVAANMNDPRLNYQSGRFAGSVRVTDITKTPKGFPSIGYTYDKFPYQTFEPGFAQGSVQRDPRRLIDTSIRELAIQFAIGRFYTRRV